MNYLNKSLIDGLASRYVIGSMKGLARLRFQRLMQDHVVIDERVHYWEQLLDPLNDGLEVSDKTIVISKQRSLKVLRQRLGFNVMNQVEGQVGWWRRLGLLSTTAAVLLAVTLAWQIQFSNQQLQNIVTSQQVVTQQNAVEEAQSGEERLVSPVSSIAVISDSANQPLWIIELAEQNIHIQATSAITKSNDYDYELWFVRQGDKPPVSLGVVPQQGQLKQLCPDIFDEEHLAALAISREAKGGSRSGSPAKVLYATSMVAI